MVTDSAALARVDQRNVDLWDPTAAGAELAHQAHRFEDQLFKALVVARAAFAFAAFTVITAAALTGSFDASAGAIWALLALWTAATAPYAWRRLGWLRTMPAIVWVEITILVLLVFIGVGTRQWHLLHCFVPLVFAAFFTPARNVRIVAVALVVALWASYVGGRAWPGLPIEAPERALVPSIVVVVGAVVLVFVRHVIGDIERLVAAQRDATEQIERSRRVIAAAADRLQMYRVVAHDVERDVSELVEKVTRSDLVSSGADADDVVALNACIRDLDEAVKEMEVADPSADGPASIHTEIAFAIERTASLGGSVSHEFGTVDREIEGPVVVPFRRLVTEAIANARKHGAGTTRVAVTAEEALSIEVASSGEGTVASRPGGRGLASMRHDAALLDGTVTWTEGDGGVVVRIQLPEVAEASGVDPIDLGATTLRLGIDRRRAAFESAVLVARAAVAVLVAVSIQVLSSKHHTLLPALTVASIVVVGCSVVLLILHWRTSHLLITHRWLIVADCIVIVLLVAALGGMGSPWMPVALGAVLLAGVYLDAKTAGLFVALLGVAMAAGYEIVLATGWDDQGTREQHMPLGLVQNVVTFCVIGGIGVAIGWLLTQTDEAVSSYENTARRQFEVARQAARADARADTGRHLHSSLEQYVKAALLRLGAISRSGEEVVWAHDIESRLLALRDRLEAWEDRLSAGTEEQFAQSM